MGGVPTLSVDGSESLAIVNDGKVVLEFNRGNDAAVVLEHAPEAAFSGSRVSYRVTDTAKVITGLAEGDHFFRVRAADVGAGVDDGWSNVLRVRVEYMDRRTLVVLLVVGFVVAAMTAGAVIAGGRAARRMER